MQGEEEEKGGALVIRMRIPARYVLIDREEKRLTHVTSRKGMAMQTLDGIPRGKGHTLLHSAILFLLPGVGAATNFEITQRERKTIKRTHKTDKQTHRGVRYCSIIVLLCMQKYVSTAS